MPAAALGMLEQDTCYRTLDALGDPLMTLSKIVPRSIFDAFRSGKPLRFTGLARAALRIAQPLMNSERFNP